MPGHRSFVPSDFSLRDVFSLLVGAGALWLFGTMSDSLPTFWKGVLCGFGLGFVLASSLRSRPEGARAAHLSEPHASPAELPESVRVSLDDPTCVFASPGFIEAIKLYKEATGASLREATDTLKQSLEQRHRGS